MKLIELLKSEKGDAVETAQIELTVEERKAELQSLLDENKTALDKSILKIKKMKLDPNMNFSTVKDIIDTIDLYKRSDGIYKNLMKELF